MIVEHIPLPNPPNQLLSTIAQKKKGVKKRAECSESLSATVVSQTAKLKETATAYRSTGPERRRQSGSNRAPSGFRLVTACFLMAARFQRSRDLGETQSKYHESGGQTLAGS